MCTGIRTLVKNNEDKNEATFFSRTLEFGIDVKSEIVFKSNSDENKYDYIGFDVLGSKKLIEGCNEEGLYVGAFYFPGYAEYPKESDAKVCVSSIDFVDYCLSNCSSVEEVKDKLEQKEVDIISEDWAPLADAFNKVCDEKKDAFAPPLHWIMIDKSGETYVLEYTKNGRLLKNNSYGVFTNSPDFEWMCTNIRNYASLSPFNDNKAIEIFNQKINNFGQGAGMMGLPGDFTPPSRFIRALALSSTAKPVKSKKDALNLAWHLIDNFDISKGNALVKDTPCNVDNTQWVSVYDINEAKIYFRDYNNPVIREISLSEVKNQCCSSEVSFSIDSGEPKFQKFISK